MREKYVEENGYYLISNHAVAKNPLFGSVEQCKRFIEKIDLHLTNLVEILAYSFNRDQYQIAVKIKKRSEFIDYYRLIKEDPDLSEDKIPHSNYIFSQAMANLQSGTALHFNSKVSRSGSLFASRFSKRLIPRGEKLRYWVDRLNENLKLHVYDIRWRENGERLGRKGMWFISSWVYYFHKKANKDRVIGSLRLYFQDELQGRFLITDSTKIARIEQEKFIRIRHKLPFFPDHPPP